MSIATAAAPDQVFPIWTVCLLGFFDALFDDTGGVPSCHRVTSVIVAIHLIRSARLRKKTVTE
jgi:hypothetical protein